MKEIRTIKMVEQVEVKFVADDGKVFVGDNAESNCLSYERQRDRQKVEDAFKRLDAIELTTPFIDWFNDSCCLWKITLTSKQDYFAMTDYFKVLREVWDTYVEEPTEYPCTMLIGETYDCLSVYRRDLKEELQKTLEQLG